MLAIEMRRSEGVVSISSREEGQLTAVGRRADSRKKQVIRAIQSFQWSITHYTTSLCEYCQEPETCWQ